MPQRCRMEKAAGRTACRCDLLAALSVIPQLSLATKQSPLQCPMNPLEADLILPPPLIPAHLSHSLHPPQQLPQPPCNGFGLTFTPEAAACANSDEPSALPQLPPQGHVHVHSPWARCGLRGHTLPLATPARRKHEHI